MLKLKTKALLAPAFVALSVVAAQPAFAGGDAKLSKVEKQQQIDREMFAKAAADQLAKHNKGKKVAKSQASLDAIAALQATQQAVAALDKKDGKKAMAFLEAAIGKVELVLALQPDLALAPVDVRSEIVDVYANVETMKKARDKAIDLLKQGRLQDARPIVAGLASEIVVSVTNVPLATYPDAIKLAVPLIEKGKYKEAREALLTALNTMVVEKHIIPLPVLRAERDLAEAEKLAENAKRSKDQEKKLAQLLAQGRKELKYAQVLGYGEKADFEGFYKEIEKISEKTRDGKFGKGYFDEIKKTLAKLRNKLF